MNSNINKNKDTLHDHNETKQSSGPTTSRPFTLDIKHINPMHLRNRSPNSTHPETELVSIRERRFTSLYPQSNDQDVPPPEISRITQISQICQSGLLYIVVTALLGFVFILAQLTAYSVDNTIKIHFWYNVDLVELLFNIAILSATVHVVLNANGTVPKYKRYALGCVICLWAVVILVVGQVPASYLQIRNITTTTEPDRGSCHSIQKRNKEIPLLGSCYDSFATGDTYVQYAYKNSTGTDLDLNMQTATKGIETLYRFGQTGVLFKFAGDFEISKPFHGQLSPTCFPKIIDLACSDLVKNCRHTDCVPVSPICLQIEQLALINQLVDCTKMYCVSNSLADCSTINVATFEKELQEYIPRINEEMAKRFQPETSDVLKLMFDRILYSYDQATNRNTSKSMTKCGGWSNIVDDLQKPATISNESSLTNLTCDPTIRTFEQIETIKVWNSSALLVVVSIYFIIVVMVFGQFGRIGGQHLKLHLSTVRMVSSLTGILMAALIYIGSIHLHKETSKDSFQMNKEAQKIWRVIYLIVSFFTVYGSVLILVPSEDDKKEKEEQQQEQQVHTYNDSDNNDDASLSETCCTATLDALQAFKAQFWDASGDFFYLKLIIMEILEITLQLTSLASSAASSHAAEVLLSSLLISANFIVLPIIIIIIPNSFKSNPNALIATVMVVEVLFDKLYVGIGVLLRYNTLVDTNMDFMAQATVHGALLLPALMTALDIQDALDLSDHMDTLLEETAMIKIRSKAISTISNKFERWTHNIIFVTLKRVGLVLSIIIGLSFGIYVSYIVDFTNHECDRRIGKIAACAKEKFYFRDGFFNTTTCAFDRVETFRCTGDQALGSSFEVLPNAEEEYANMWNLKSIIVSNSSLKRAPLGWALVPNEFSIDISDSSNFSGLPFNLCSMQSNLTAIKLQGTFAASSVDWTGQLLAKNESTTIPLSNRNDCSDTPCSQCEGLCSKDSDCAGNLICSTNEHTNEQFHIPGCSGSVFVSRVRNILYSQRENFDEQNHLRFCYSKQNLKNTDYKHINKACQEGLQNVETLSIGNNTLTNEDLKFENLGGIISKFTKLKQLDLQNNNLQQIKIETLENVFRPIVERNILNEGASLFLGGNPLITFKIYSIQRKYAQGWLNVINNCTSINHISIDACEFGGEAFNQLLFMLSSLQGIDELYVGHNNIETISLDALRSMAQSTLRFIDLYANKIGSSALFALSQILSTSKLIKIDLRRNTIESSSGLTAFIEALPNSKILDIDLSDNTIGSSGLIVLSAVLRQSKVFNIGLNINDIDDAGLIVLAKALPQTQIMNIHLNKNKISDAGAIALAEALPTSKVTDIRLNTNNIGDNGTISLAEALPMSKVTDINLMWNKISDAGAIALAEALPKSKVTFIELRNNTIGEVGLIALQSVCRNYNLTSTVDNDCNL